MPGSGKIIALGGGGSGTVTNVTGTSPVVSSGGSTPAISISGVTGEQGNGALLQLSTGTPTTNTVVKFDANGNTVNSSISDNGTVVTMAEQVKWTTGLGAITQILGPTDQPLAIASANLQNVTLTAGNASLTASNGSGVNVNSFSVNGASGGSWNASGVISRYKSIATVSSGVPSELATVDLTAQGAAISATTLYAVPASGAGMYRISWIAKVTQAASVSSSLGGANSFQITYTDPADSTTPTVPQGSMIFVNAGNATTTAIQGVIVIYAKASTNIQYQMDYTSTGVTPMQYNLHVKLEALG